MNLLKQRMISGESVFGTWCMLPSSFTVDVIAKTGLDYIVIDMEHGTITLETAENMVRAAQLAGCQPIIRVGDDHDNTILHALETGCEAILVPNVASVESAKKIANATRYAPSGMRGLSPYTRCHGYTHVNLEDSILKHSADTLVGVLVEGKIGIDNLEEIAAVSGIDLIYLGMYDISQSIGLTGQLEHPRVMNELERCLTIIKRSGKLAGTFSRDISACKNFKNMGFEFIAYVADCYGLHTFFKDSVTKFNKI
jgi:4-hydroxy-2-oxoheptanedioate aldolase